MYNSGLELICGVPPRGILSLTADLLILAELILIVIIIIVTITLAETFFDHNGMRG